LKRFIFFDCLGFGQKPLEKLAWHGYSCCEAWGASIINQNGIITFFGWLIVLVKLHPGYNCRNFLMDKKDDK
jgi:hypothetical protein